MAEDGASRSTKERLRVLIGVTSEEVVHARFAHGFSVGLAHMAQFCEVAPIFVVNREVSMARQMIVEEGVSNGFDIVIVIDDMVIIHPNALGRLIVSEHPVTAFNHVEKVMDSLIFSARLGVAPVPTRDSDSGYQLVDKVGLQFFQLTLTSGFRQWFGKGRNLFHSLGRSPEDHFADMMKRAGLPLHIDHDLSKLCGVLGQYTMYAKHAEA